jgi:hypothetical protein
MKVPLGVDDFSITYGALSRVDVAGSNRISRFMFSITCREFTVRGSTVFEVTRYLEALKSLMIRGLNNRYAAACAGT